MACYHLPHHPALTSLDPLGICVTDAQSVTHGELLSELLLQAEQDLQRLEHDHASTALSWIQRLQRLLGDVAYSLHGDHAFDAGGLKEPMVMEELTSTSSRRCFRECLFESARKLSQIFPDAQLTYLSLQCPSVICSGSAMDAILGHMFLGTLQIPPGNTWGRPGFSQYLDSKIVSVVPNTAPAYLKTIVMHFIQGGYSRTRGAEQMFDFKLSKAVDMPALRTVTSRAVRIPVVLVDQPRDPSPRDHSFVLVAANAQPGPGASGTHEERLVGQSPALAIVSLLAPVLQEDEAVITSPLPVHALWRGHGRTAEMINTYAPNERPSRCYLVADALPLDLSHKQADLRSGNVHREVRKLYAAFSGAMKGLKPTHPGFMIEMPPWGCGAFGGSLSIKVPCMMMAAGLAGVESKYLELLVPKGISLDSSFIPQKQTSVSELFNNLAIGDS